MTEPMWVGMRGRDEQKSVQQRDIARRRTMYAGGRVHTLRWALFCAFVLMAGVAHAGIYTVSYSGGTWTLDGVSSNYNGSGGSWGGGGGAAHSASCQGAITATFTWQANDPSDVPPDVVIVEETATATATYFGAKPTGTGSAVADNGLGSTPVVVNNPTPGGLDYEITSMGTKYTIKNSPGATFTMTGSPTATSSVTLGSCTAGVSYSAIPHVVNLIVAGTTPSPGEKNILIGQGASAFLDCPGVTFQNIAWSVTGDTFKLYEAHGLASGRYARVTEMTAADWSQPSPVWYWRSDSSSQVVARADAFVNGMSIGSIVASRTVVVWCPTYYCPATPGNVQVYAYTPSTRVLGAGKDVVPYAPGIKWRGNVVPDNVFATDIGRGLWSFVQIVTSHRSYKDSSGIHNLSINDQTGLDDSYPYAPDQNVKQQDDNNQGHKDNGTDFTADDTPYSNLTDSMLSYSANDNYKTYMMYRPAATTIGNQWVPIERISWNWQANITRPGNSWKNHALPWIIGPVTVSENARCKTHPLWTLVIVADIAVYVP